MNGMGYQHKMVNKRGTHLVNKAVIHIIIVGVVFVLFFMAVGDSINGRGVKQQILEKQLALLIDSAAPGMSFEVPKKNLHGFIQKIELGNGKIFVAVEGLFSIEGYPYFSRYQVNVIEEDNKFIIKVE